MDELFDKEVLNKILNEFSKLIDHPIYFIDNEGKEIVINKKLPFICELIKSKSNLCCDFRKSNDKESECHAGFMNLFSNVVVNDEVIGKLIIPSIKIKKEHDFSKLAGIINVEKDELDDEWNNIELNNNLEVYRNVLESASNLISLSMRSKDNEEKLKELKILNEITNLMQSSLNLNDIVIKAINYLTPKLNFVNCTLDIFENGKYYYVNPNEMIEKVMKEVIVKDKSILSIRNAKTDILFEDIDDIEESSILSMPIRRSKEVIGMISFYYKVNDKLSEEKFNLIINLTNQLTLAILNALYFQKTQESSIVDKLTNLYNRAYFNEMIKKEVAKSSRLNRALSLVLFDIDNFKGYNDNYGHPAGDKLLRMVGDIVKRNIREIDNAFRYGGEEFAILFPETGHDEAFVAAERLRKGIEKYEFPFRKISISIGLVTCLNSSLSENEMIEKADEALYMAKRSGKNKTISKLVVDRGLGTIDIQKL